MSMKAWPIFFLRIALGWLFLYAGASKIANVSWSAASYLGNAKTLPDFYAFLASPGILPATNILNEWALFLLGLSLLLGVGMKITAPLGVALMLLYYIPIFQFPLIKGMSFIVEEHVVYSLALLTVAFFEESRIFSLGKATKIPLLS